MSGINRSRTDSRSPVSRVLRGILSFFLELIGMVLFPFVAFGLGVGVVALGIYTGWNWLIFTGVVIALVGVLAFRDWFDL